MISFEFSRKAGTVYWNKKPVGVISRTETGFRLRLTEVRWMPDGRIVHTKTTPPGAIMHYDNRRLFDIQQKARHVLEVVQVERWLVRKKQ